MISIIVCSVKPELLKNLRNNIEETVGVTFEVIAINNKDSAKGICQAYNEGMESAMYDTLCFCHEDILFKTSNWGTMLTQLLGAHEDLGLIGICGATYKSSYPTPWISVPQQYYRSNIIQLKTNGEATHEPILEEGDYSEVVVLDGCFIAGRRTVFQEYKWNDSLLTGFQLYDIELCIRVGKKYKLGVVNSFKLMHLSSGSFDRKWLSDSERVHDFYKNDLPVSKLIGAGELSLLDYYSLRSYVARLIKLKQGRIKIFKFIAKLLITFPFKRGNLQILRMFLIH